jgi:hypothetical protein
MGKGYISRFYKTMSPVDQRTYNRWLKANAILGLILAGGLVAMAIARRSSRRMPGCARGPRRVLGVPFA